MPLSASEQRRWLEQWRAAGPALEEVRRRELRALTHEEALRASEALLALAGCLALDPRRRESSGLVEQQAILHRRRARG